MNYNIEIMNECGYNEAMVGLSLSYNRPVYEMGRVAKKIYKQGSHGKFLESMQIWLDINMPRYWWSEFDTYRVGTTKQSESTMHTIFKKQLAQEDFVEPIYEDTLKNLNSNIRWYIESETKESKQYWFRQIKRNLPEGFLQRRIVCTNYKVLRNIIQQRKTHKLEEWGVFVKFLKDNCRYREFLEDL